MRNALVVLALSLFARPVDADVIDSTWAPPRCPTLQCPAGSAAAPSGSHSGCSPGCRPSAECERDADCSALGDGARCVQTRFCVGEGYAARLGPTPVVHGECSGDGSCAEGECSVTRRCAAPPPALEPTPSTPPPSTRQAPVDPEEGVVVEGPATDDAEGADRAAPTEPEPREGGGCAVARVGRRVARIPLWLGALPLFIGMTRRRDRGRRS